MFVYLVDAVDVAEGSRDREHRADRGQSLVDLVHLKTENERRVVE